LPPPADGTIYLIGDKTIKQKSGKKQPLDRSEAKWRKKLDQSRAAA
jgi:hypothetical protein